MLAWVFALVAIVAALILGTAAASRRMTERPPSHSVLEVLATRGIAVVVITILVALALTAWGELPAVIIATACVAAYAYWASIHGYARLPGRAR